MGRCWSKRPTILIIWNMTGRARSGVHFSISSRPIVGLSDWEVNDLSLEAFVRDLESVDRFPLLRPVAGLRDIDCLRHPDRVTQLILYGGFARGRRKRGSREDIAKNDALETLIRQGWGQDNPAFRQMLTSLFMPDATTAKRIHSMIYSASRHPPTPRGCVARLTR
jgi:hypothetical protein